MSHKVEYALLAALDLAVHYAPRSRVKAGEISRRTRAPKKYLTQLLLLLKERMLVRSTRGPTGGYELMRRPELISVAEVIEAVAPSGGRSPAARPAGDGYAGAINWLTGRMAESRRALLSRITLADLVRKAGAQEPP